MRQARQRKGDELRLFTFNSFTINLQTIDFRMRKNREREMSCMVIYVTGIINLHETKNVAGHEKEMSWAVNFYNI